MTCTVYVALVWNIIYCNYDDGDDDDDDDNNNKDDDDDNRNNNNNDKQRFLTPGHQG